MGIDHGGGGLAQESLLPEFPKETKQFFLKTLEFSMESIWNWNGIGIGVDGASTVVATTRS